MWQLIWTYSFCFLGCIVAIAKLDSAAGTGLCASMYFVGMQGRCDDHLCVFLFQRRLAGAGFPHLEIQISTHKMMMFQGCFKCLWRSLETKLSCQEISVMFFFPMEYGSAVKKQYSKSSVIISNTTSSEVRA